MAATIIIGALIAAAVVFAVRYVGKKAPAQAVLKRGIAPDVLPPPPAHMPVKTILPAVTDQADREKRGRLRRFGGASLCVTLPPGGYPCWVSGTTGSSSVLNTRKMFRRERTTS